MSKIQPKDCQKWFKIYFQKKKNSNNNRKVDQNLFGHPVIGIGVKIEFDIPE